MEEVDALTLARARRGERSAIETIVRRHQDAVYAAAGRILISHPSQVDDVAQETFVKVVKHLARFDPAGTARLSTWILAIATRTAIDALRRARLRAVPELEPDDRPADDPDPESSAAQNEIRRRIEKAMAALPDDQRAVLVLRAFHDFDYDEIARALDLEVGTVKSRLSRARSALRAALEEN